MRKVSIILLPFLLSCATVMQDDRKSSQVVADLLPFQTEPDFSTEQSARKLIKNACNTENFKIKIEGKRWASDTETRATWAWIVGEGAKPPKMVYYWKYICIK